MALPEADVSGSVVRLYWVAWIDIAGQPVRATTLPSNITFSGTGDTDLDGQTFLALDHKLVEIGDVTHQKGGADTVTATLKGLPGVDDDLLTVLATKSNWQGRDARLWCGELSGTTATNPRAYYTGRINKLLDLCAPDSRTISIEIESYLSLLTQARGRTYQDQTEHDASDLSPLRMRSAANGTRGSGVGTGGYGYGNGLTEQSYAF